MTVLRKWIVRFLEAASCCNVTPGGDDKLWKDLGFGVDCSKPPIPKEIAIPCHGKFDPDDERTEFFEDHDLCMDENSTLYGDCSEMRVDEVKLFFRPEKSPGTTTATTTAVTEEATTDESSIETSPAGETWTNPTTTAAYGFI
mmetsp:Transcript_2230/g.3032  ORF Transcript_2230/g.3032 Transcript_2230/m.3032 type:complete len:143 (-) Transcript_2230:73-501(-)|eukprot:CAMPEP_0194032332 /NCGR_PEP_ID=MMETSP0009_2-20130614/5303_1 /TAXON_ID=210454 /ORGANISM="Grammatophora oceanica, Strain CCMP 410" /LENGTH=142 /DNA_ID=CAMNT_0038672741 /DNA_START=101 /DNA_END=529 /DNA_ORIENTATION=+